MPTKSQMETQALSGKDHTFLHLHVRSAGDNWAAVSMSAMAVGSHDSYSCSCDLSACEEITPYIQKNGALRTPLVPCSVISAFSSLQAP